MAEKTSIEWCDHTFNCWRGCTKVSPGCANCYAETMSGRNPSVLGAWGPDGVRVVAAESYWRQPLKWDREAAAAGERRRVFCLSLGDVFEDWQGTMTAPDGRTLYEVAGDWVAKDKPPPGQAGRLLRMADVRRRLFQLIARTPNLDWLLLTKRPEIAVDNWPLWAGYYAATVEDSAVRQRIAQDFILPNVWLGVSVEDQVRAEERIPLLLRTPAAVRFLSCEPLLGPVNLRTGIYAMPPAGPDRGTSLDGIHWVIIGGESGHGARQCDVEWIRSIRDQCKVAGVPVFVKQLGSYPTDCRAMDTIPGARRKLSLAEAKSPDGLAAMESCLNAATVRLADRKGGSPDEWPEDLRVREWPEVDHA